MKQTNTAVATQTKQTFSSFINSNSVKNMISNTLSDPRRSASFAATLISSVAKTPKLQECDQASILSAALEGEANNLSLSLGEFSIVPYGKTAQYQISVKGLTTMAIRTGLYSDIDVLDVREGEFKGINPRNRKPIIEWNDNYNERIKLPIVGFYGYFELVNGFFRCKYMSHEEILQHADMYSSAFNLDTYRKMLNGEMSTDEILKKRSGSPWYGDPSSAGHQKMCIKTVLKQLLNDGYAPKSMELQTQIERDNGSERGGGIISADDPLVIAQNSAPVRPKEETKTVVVDTETGEIVSDTANSSQNADTDVSASRSRKSTTKEQKSAESNPAKSQSNPHDIPEGFMNIPEPMQDEFLNTQEELPFN